MYQNDCNEKKTYIRCGRRVGPGARDNWREFSTSCPYLGFRGERESHPGDKTKET